MVARMSKTGIPIFAKRYAEGYGSFILRNSHATSIVIGSTAYTNKGKGLMSMEISDSGYSI